MTEIGEAIPLLGMKSNRVEGIYSLSKAMFEYLYLILSNSIVSYLSTLAFWFHFNIFFSIHPISELLLLIPCTLHCLFTHFRRRIWDGLTPFPPPPHTIFCENWRIKSTKQWLARVFSYFTKTLKPWEFEFYSSQVRSIQVKKSYHNSQQDLDKIRMW